MDFRECFQNEVGQRCLKQLERMTFARVPTEIQDDRVRFNSDGKVVEVGSEPIDPIKHWRRDGMRAVYWLIQGMIEQSDAALAIWQRRQNEWSQFNVGTGPPGVR